MRTIALFSEKGGSGKTTLSANLGAAFASGLHAGKPMRVLLVDSDSQGNLTDTATDGAQPEEGLDLAGVLMGDCEPRAAVIPATRLPGCDIIPGGSTLADASVLLTNEVGRELRLRHALAELAGDYDLCIIDCPPGRGLLSVGALAAADEVLIPTDSGRHGILGMQKALQLVEDVRKHVPRQDNPGAPRLLGQVLNRCQKNKTDQEAEATARSAWGDKLLAVIPNGVAVGTATWDARAVVLTHPTSAPSKAIIALVKEIARVGRTANAA
jgi:chromosome partitioning protein